MGKLISVHEYTLKPEVSPEGFELAVRAAEVRGLLNLPGLTAHHFVKGIRGERQGDYAMIWVYESQAAWERLWGAINAPRPPEDFPVNWQIWEGEVLRPFLDRHPDRISFTSYLEVDGTSQ